MAKINLDNYEAYLLDFFEGNLSGEDTRALEAFALLHPELNIDLGENPLPHISTDNTSYDLKSSLIKTSEFIEDEALINYVEGNFNAEQKQAFESELNANPQLKKELEQYQKTKLQADNTELFAAKQQLVKTEEDLILNNKALAFVEGKLNAEEKAEFETELKSNKQLGADVIAFNKTILKADNSIQYPNKESLKKKTAVFFLFDTRVITRAAAAIFLFVSITVIYLYLKPQTNTPDLAQKTNKDSLNTLPVTKQPTLKTNNVVPFNNETYTKLAQKHNHYTNETTKPVKHNVTTNTNEEHNTKPDIQLVQNNTNQTNTNIIDNSLTQSTITSITNATIAANQAQTTVVKTETEITATNYQSSYQVAVASDDEDDIVPVKKQSFWKRAVNVAHRANNLGLKSINGEENKNKTLLLSFNSFSIEKK